MRTHQSRTISKLRQPSFKAEMIDLTEESRRSGVQEYYKEACYLAKKHNVPLSKVEICPDHPVGEIVLFVDRVWQGYLDTDFYYEMDTGKSRYEEEENESES